MNASVSKRLAILEGRVPLAIMATCTNIETGITRNAPIREFINEIGIWRLDRITDGNNLRDIDAYLTEFKRYVEEAEHE